MKNPAFVFDDVSVTPDRQIGLHAHRQWELSHVIVGSGTRTVGDRTGPIRQGGDRAYPARHTPRMALRP